MRTDTFVRYMANAGFLLARGGRAVGIDVFAADSQGLYKDTPRQIRDELFAGIRAGEISALLFTHEHGDHFCAEDTALACSLNPSLQVFGSKKICRILADRGTDRKQLHELTDSGDPPECLVSLLRRSFKDENASLRILPAVHEGAHYADIQNLCFLLFVGGDYIVFAGDAALGDTLFQDIAAWSEEIDWLFIPFPAVGIGSSRRAMMNAFKTVRHVFACHLPRPERDAQQWTMHTEMALQTLHSDQKRKFPDVIMPKQLGDWYRLDTGDDER